jgi:hypothetical protein
MAGALILASIYGSWQKVAASSWFATRLVQLPAGRYSSTQVGTAHVS